MGETMETPGMWGRKEGCTATSLSWVRVRWDGGPCGACRDPRVSFLRCLQRAPPKSLPGPPELLGAETSPFAVRAARGVNYRAISGKAI